MIKKILKGLGRLAALSVILTLLYLVNLFFMKPYSIDHYLGKELVFGLIDSPEAMTYIGVFDRFNWLTKHNSKLSIPQEDDIEKELAELKKSESENKQEVKKKPKTRNEKIRLLLAMKAIELTKKIEKEVSIEQNMIMQRQLLALISYVPGFDYADKKLNQVNFYPPKPTVDHAFARWYLNDPNFVEMENLQYNFK